MASRIWMRWAALGIAVLAAGEGGCGARGPAQEIDRKGMETLLPDAKAEEGRRERPSPPPTKTEPLKNPAPVPANAGPSTDLHLTLMMEKTRAEVMEPVRLSYALENRTDRQLTVLSFNASRLFGGYRLICTDGQGREVSHDRWVRTTARENRGPIVQEEVFIDIAPGGKIGKHMERFLFREVTYGFPRPGIYHVQLVYEGGDEERRRKFCEEELPDYVEDAGVFLAKMKTILRERVVSNRVQIRVEEGKASRK
ncbi:MAG: hypothetical protein ACYTHM_02275 [Planctomycetota bacterium]|jgi:hypothetical protein